MSAVILPFPSGRRDRARPATIDGFAEPTLEGRVRAIGFRFGLNHFDRESLVTSAKRWVQCGISEMSVLVRAETNARSIAANKPQGPGAA
jgi:hypothetical protein